GAEAALQERTAAEARLRTEHEAADAAARQAADALQSLERRHLAHALAATPVPGEPCPVCDHGVDRVPDRERVAALTDARQSVAEAQSAATRSQNDRSAAEKLVAATTAQLETLAGQRARLAAPVEAHPDVPALDALIGRVEGAE